MLPDQRRRKTERVRITCNECGKAWYISGKGSLPTCPRCNGADVEIGDVVLR